MARSQGGPLGSISGKFGSVVAYKLRGKDVIRGLPKKSKKKPSLKQLAHRKKFAHIQKWRSALTSLFAITFKNHTNERSAQNAAHRCNMDIITGEYPYYEIDYTRVVISSGNLPSLKDVAMTVDEHKVIHVTWNDYIENGAKQFDQVAILICYDDVETSEFSTTVADRMLGQFKYQLKEYTSANEFAHVYITVISDDRERAADSQYMGKIDL